MTPSEPMDERLIELELRYTHLQHLVDQLNDVIVSQQRELDLLARELRELRGAVAGASRDGSGGADHERPPHY